MNEPRSISSNQCTHPTIVGSPGDWHCENCLRTFFPSGDTGAEQEAVLLRAALQTFVSRAKSWHKFHHGSEVIQCDLLCDAIPIGEAALSGNGSTPETHANCAKPDVHHPACNCLERERRDAARYRVVRVSKLTGDVLAHELDAACDALIAARSAQETKS